MEQIYKGDNGRNLEWMKIKAYSTVSPVNSSGIALHTDIHEHSF